MAQPKRLGKARRPPPNQVSAADERLDAGHRPGSRIDFQSPRTAEVIWFLLALCVVGLVALQPISAEDLWWQLSRGRQVLLGSVQPSADLLALETSREADWLGGLPGYLLYGSLGASGLMLARLGIVIGLAWQFLKRPTGAASPLRPWWGLLTGGIALLALSPMLDPLPTLFDLTAIVLLWSLLNWGPPRASRHTLWIAALFLAWSNLSFGITLGAALLLAAALATTFSGNTAEARFHWRDLLVAMVAGSLNPRGIWAWGDSARILLPAASVSPAVLEQTPWVPLPRAVWGFTEYAFVALTLLWMGRCWWSARGGRRSRSLRFLLVEFLGWFSAANVPLAIAWLACDLVGDWKRPSSNSRSDPSSDSSGDASIAGKSPLQFTAWGRLGIAAGLAIAVLISGRLASFGWGIEARLDYRLLEIALSETAPHGTAVADDVRSGGMLVWTLPPSRGERLSGELVSGEDDPMRLQDIPRRALLGGRLAEHQHLMADLRFGRSTRYWREDRSPGGSWLTLQSRNTSLICVSADDFELVRGLEPTIWKPLSLDSPVIPYARAGDAAYAEQLVAVLRYRQLVDLEPWNYEVPPSSGSAFDRDRMGLRETAASQATVLRQARTFRAMKLHYAALRVLFVGRQLWPEDPQLKEEVRRCQAELAHQERRVAGQASWLRDWAAQSRDPTEIEPRDPPRLGRPQRLNRGRSDDDKNTLDHRVTETNDAQERSLFLRQIQEYLRAGPQAALESARRSLPGSATIPQHPQLAYAWLCWALESGAHDLAREIGRDLAARPLPPNLHLLVRFRIEELGPPLKGPLTEESAL